MRSRRLWSEAIERHWRSRPIVWLSGVRRIGKTTLCHQLANTRLLNCDRPSIRSQVDDVESFLAEAADSPNRLALDEIHRLPNPSLLLKLAADEYPDLKLVATGSSTLAATSKFRDSLTGRKHELHLTPVLWRECLDEFSPVSLDRRLLAGGFPEQLLADAPSPDFFEEWIDSFYARDVQDLFGVRNRSGFLSLLRLVCLRSGGQLEISDLAKKAQLSRPTVMSHLDALEIAGAVTRLRPFHGGGSREIVKQPKIYSFDTGLVAHVAGWEQIRSTDRGHLWEHLVLDELRADFPLSKLRYWRDKSQREIDFVIDRGRAGVDLVEAKVDAERFDGRWLAHFRQAYPDGSNYVAVPRVDEPYRVTRGGVRCWICRPDQISQLALRDDHCA